MPIDRSRDVDPQTAEIRRPPNRGNSACISKGKPTNSLSNFVHVPPRTPSLRCDPAPWLPPLSPSHGEDIHPQGWPCSGLVAMAATAARLACLPATGRRRVAASQQPQQWLQQRRKVFLRKRQQRRRRPTAGSNGPSTEMSSSRPAINCKQCNHARLVSLADSTLQMKTQRVLVDSSLMALVCSAGRGVRLQSSFRSRIFTSGSSSIWIPAMQSRERANKGARQLLWS